MAAEAGGSVAVALGTGKVAAAVVVVVVCSAFLGPAPALEGKLPAVVVAVVVVVVVAAAAAAAMVLRPLFSCSFVAGAGVTSSNLVSLVSALSLAPAESSVSSTRSAAFGLAWLTGTGLSGPFASTITSVTLYLSRSLLSRL